LSTAQTIRNVQTEGRPLDPQAAGPDIRLRAVTPQYFETFRIPILRGALVESDETQVVVSKSAEALLFGGESAVGKHIRIQQDEPWHLVTAVAADIRNAGIKTGPQPEIYMLSTREPANAGRTGFIAVHTSAPRAVALEALRRAVADLDPQLPIRIQTVEQDIAAMAGKPRFLSLLLGSFSVLALAIVAAGIYGVVSYIVAQRTRDFGVRLALGATPRRIWRDVLGDAAAWIGAGVSTGLIGAWATRRVIAPELFQISVFDVGSWLIAIAFLTLFLFLAIIRPASRAARISPASALRLN
jgi:hypothetical protein